MSDPTRTADLTPSAEEGHPAESGAAWLSRLYGLLSEWDRRRAAGEDPTPADLCPDDPAMQEAVRRRVVGDPATAGAAPPRPVAPDDRLPDPPPGYTLERLLGEGTFGQVYLGAQVRLNRPVAIKLARVRRGRPAGLIRFLAEAQAVAAVSHPHVVRVYEYGDHDGRPFMALEYVPGGTLADRLAGRPLPPREAAGLVAKIARGAAAAHDLGIVHRDLKPGNVLLDAADEPKVADFGLAKVAGADLTAPGDCLGTLAYMAPEQARGEAKFVGPPADVWSLGVILYECLTGGLPFDVDRRVLPQRIQNDDPPAVGSRAPGVPRDLELICRKCLAKDPRDRYPSAAELAADLDRFGAGESVSVRLPGPAERAVKWVRRNPIPAALIAAVSLGLVGTAVGGILAARAERRATQEQAARVEAERKEAAAVRARLVAASGSAVRLASQRGAAREALAAFDEAVAAGLPITPEMRFDKAKAHSALGNTDAALAELTALDSPDLPADLRGPVDLYTGVMLIGRDDARARTLVPRARAAGLEPADDHFAQGLMAATLPTALGHFRTAIAIDPAHVEARAMAGLALLAVGELDHLIRLAEETRLFVPQHPDFPLQLAVGWAFKGDREKARHYHGYLRPQFPDDDEFRTMGEFLDAIVLTRGLLPQAAGHAPPPPGFAPVAVARLMRPDMKQLFGRLGLRPGGDGTLSVSAIRFPPVVRDRFQVVIAELVAASLGQNAPAARLLAAEGLPAPVLQFTDEAGATAARARLETHPDGLLWYLYASRLDDLAQADLGKPGVPIDAWRRRYAEAGAAFAVASRTPSLYDHGLLALDRAIASYAMAGAPRPGAPAHAEFVRKGVDLIRERVRRPEPLPDAVRGVIMTAVAQFAREFGLARMLLDHYEKEFPADLRFARRRAWTEEAAGAYGPALKAAERYLTDAPDDPEMFRVARRAREELRRPELAPPPRPRRPWPLGFGRPTR